MKRKMQGKIMVVTGASSGIGRALSLEGLSRGMKVVMAARNLEGLQETAALGDSPEGQFLLVRADVTRQEDCQRLIQTTLKEFGRIDILINNAGVSMRALFEEVDLEVLDRLMRVNFWGAVYTTKFALPYLLASKGSLVGISSVAGHKGLPARTGYSASKFALRGFMETLRIENLKKGLHVMVASPGFTTSNIRKTALSRDGSPQGESPRAEDKMMSAELAAWHIMNAIGKRKRELVLTPEGKLIILLNKIIPGLLDKMIYDQMAREDNSPLK
ncbi:MAG: SDR family oxidoreductase [Bacteroides sp.]|jgi:NAD(P)-dependent dehydrogenase (short-subunit alcohol dehydrogenase family)|nr:SDR family oxidoreductase [Bacteroides sp.]